MKFFLLWVTFNLGLVSSSAWGKESIRAKILSLLPHELSSLNHEVTRQEIESRFSKKIIKKDPKETFYLGYFEDKNDVSIGIKDERFDYLYVEVPRSIVESQPGLFQYILERLTPAKKSQILQKNENKRSHDKGRFLIIDLPDEGLKLEFLNSGEKPLHSAIIYPQVKK